MKFVEHGCSIGDPWTWVDLIGLSAVIIFIVLLLLIPVVF